MGEDDAFACGDFRHGRDGETHVRSGEAEEAGSAPTRHQRARAAFIASTELAGVVSLSADTR